MFTLLGIGVVVVLVMRKHFLSEHFKFRQIYCSAVRKNSRLPGLARRADRAGNALIFSACRGGPGAGGARFILSWSPQTSKSTHDFGVGATLPAGVRESHDVCQLALFAIPVKDQRELSR